MDGKKISFGFSKVTKKPALQLSKSVKPDEASKIELIKCLEDQQIQLLKDRKETAPLVIPLKDGGKTSAALASLAKRRAVLLGEDDEPVAKKSAQNIEQPASNGGLIEATQSLDKIAEQEILAELQAKTETENESNLILPLVKPDELPLDGAKESNLDDYESIPIDQYGWAMLRGMGAVEPPKSEQKLPIDSGPIQRPAGMGLGADKALKPKPLLEMPEANEKLEIKKQAFVRILAGKHKDAYGQIEGFDHERGTIIVKLAIGNTKQKFQEFLCQPVSKKEYAQYGKCINKAKYEEYKKQENEHGQIITKKENNVKIKTEKTDREVVKAENSLQTKTEMTDSKNTNNFDKRLKSEELAGTSSSSRTNRYKSRTRSRSLSRSRKYNSKQRYEYDSLSDDYKKASESDSESDATYDRRKPKSYSSKSSNHKKKHKRHYSSSNDSDSCSDSDDTHKERSRRRKRDKKKKSKKKTKKSKKERSRSSSRRRR